jgi:hypothetical protein
LRAAGSKLKAIGATLPHTQGPWRLDKRHIYADKIIVARVQCADDYFKRKDPYFPNLGEATANARLMACAPELFEALQTLLELNPAHHSVEMCARRKEAATAVIERVMGETRQKRERDPFHGA